MKKIFSPKNKLKTFLFCFLGGWFGLHAFYVGRIKRGLLFVLSISFTSIYLFYIIYIIQTSFLGHILGFHSLSSLIFYLLSTSIISHIPFLSWIGGFGSYPIYGLFIGIALWIYDLFLISIGYFQDSERLYIVSEDKKN